MLTNGVLLVTYFTHEGGSVASGEAILGQPGHLEELALMTGFGVTDPALLCAEPSGGLEASAAP